MSIVKYTATKLNAIGKEGSIKPDANGYYTIIVGGLNTLNSAQEYYTLDGAKELFDSSSIFMRRVANGSLKGEVGHPKALPGMSKDDFMGRVLRIEETNICSHFSEIWLDENFGRNNPRFNNPKLVAIMAKVKPIGPKGPYLKEAFENKGENVCFSIRAMTRDYYSKGVNHRVLAAILTFDWVTEPGISISNKFDSPATESFQLETTDSMFMSRVTLEEIVNSKAGIAQESTREFAMEALKACSGHYNTASVPLHHKW